MKKLFFNLFLIYLLSLTTENEIDDLNRLADVYAKEFFNDFKEIVIYYLKEEHLYKNETVLVNKDQFRKIFRDIISGGSEDNVKKEHTSAFDSLTDKFVDDVFSDGKETIKGSEIDSYFTYEKIMRYFKNYKNSEVNSKEKKNIEEDYRDEL